MIDLLFLAYNRLEFTQESFRTLLANTNWERVRKLYLIDDGSTDGTKEFLRETRAPTVNEFVELRTGSPIAAKLEFWKRASADFCVALDNDVMCPPGWLDECMKPFETHGDLDVLGIEAIARPLRTTAGPRSYRHARELSSLGICRRSVFDRFGYPQVACKYWGFDRWLKRNSGIRRGWLTPSIPIFLLDRLPMNPWREYTKRYIGRGWQRNEPSWNYTNKDSYLWSWWTP